MPEVHPLPPEVITRELVSSIGSDDSTADLNTCVECLEELERSGGLA